MAKCSYCGSIIVFGGKKEGDAQFCNNTCHQNGCLVIAAKKIPTENINTYVYEMHRGPCPKCNERRGPVDVHTSYKIWSAFLFTSWKNNPQISCRSCGIRAQVSSIFSSLLLGWWGLPWGVIMTPIQIGRNVMGLIAPPSEEQPSEKLFQAVKVMLGRQLLEQSRQEQQNVEPRLHRVAKFE